MLFGCCQIWTQPGTGTSLDKFISKKISYFLMYPMLIFVTPNASLKLSQKGLHCCFFVGGLKEMLVVRYVPNLSQNSAALKA